MIGSRLERSDGTDVDLIRGTISSLYLEMTVAITVTGPKTIILTVRVMFVSVVSIVSIAVSVFRFAVFIDVSVTVSVKTWLMVNFAVVIVTLRMRGVRFVIIGGVFGGVSRGVMRGVGFVGFIRFLRVMIIVGLKSLQSYLKLKYSFRGPLQIWHN